MGVSGDPASKFFNWAILLVAGASLLTGSAYGGDIRGRVVDANTGSFLRGASVRVVELNQRTSTDPGGVFSFTNVAAGTYTLEVAFITYDLVRETIEVPGTGTVTRTISVGEEKIELEEYLVEGYREGRSLAMQQKKTAASIRDILSADSVGQLPDRNVADALVRLPGVAVDLSEGEGRFVSIRGISADLNNVTINGATISNPGLEGRNGRAMPLDVLGSSQISQLEVIKTVTPDMDAQGLGATVEIKTASAFDREEGYFNGSVEGGSVTSAEKTTYRAEGTWARRMGAEGKLGVALSTSYEWRPFSTDEVDLQWARDELLTDYDNDGVFEGEEELDYVTSQEILSSSGNRQRIGFNTKIEWKPNEDTDFYLSGIYNKFSQWFEGLESGIEGDRLDYEEDQQYLIDAGSREDRLSPFAISPSRVIYPALDQVQHRSEVENKTQSLFNLTFGARKRWGSLTLAGEFTYSFAQEEDEFENQIQFRGRLRDGEMHLRPASLIADPNNSGDDAPITSFHGIEVPRMLDPEGDGLRYDPDNQRLAEIDGPTGGDPIPVMSDTSGELPGLFAPPSAWTDLSRFAHRRNRIDTSIVEENTFIPKVDLRWDTSNFFDTGHNGFFKVGIKYFDRNRVIDDNSYRPIFCREGVDLDTCFNRENVFRRGERIRISGAEIPNLTVPSRVSLGFYDEGVEISVPRPFNESMGGMNPAGATTLFPFAINEVESSENDIEDDYDMDEKILSYYAMASVDVGEKMTFIGGVRFESTDVTVTANQWTRFDDFGDDIGALPCDNFDTGRDSTFCQQSSQSSFNYDDMFPNIQGIYRITEKLQLRGAFTVTTGRPNFEDAAPITRFEVALSEPREGDTPAEIDEVRARIRNPSLSPYYSHNYDVSLEYYSDWGALFAVAAFHKEIDDPIFTFEARDRDFSEPDDAFLPTDLNGDGTHSTVADATLVIQDKCDCTVDTSFVQAGDIVNELRMEGVENAEHGRVTGVEFTAQVPLTFLPNPLNGFSIDANAAFLSSEFDILERRDSDFQTPFFEQPSQITNFALSYQKGRFQGRVAVRYQSESFDEVADPNDPFTDRYDGEREQWDAQASYRISDRWTAYFSAQNFTNEREIRWYGRNPNRPNRIADFGAVWRFGMRWNY